MTCFIIAEAGVNHNGDDELALQLVHAAKRAGADAVKFQSFKAETLVNKTVAKAAYQKENSGEGSQFEMLKALEMSEKMHDKIISLCIELDIEFMSTGFGNQSLDYLVDAGIKRIKIPSGEITNVELIAHAASKGLPIILSTGMSTLEEVQQAIDCIRGVSSAVEISVLHCTSNYPTAPEDVNLNAMQTMADAFQLPVGYSDHTAGTLISTLAVAKGAVIIEKHFTLDKSLPGPDHKASLEPEELTHMVQQIRTAEICLGDGEKLPRDCELPVRDLVRRSITLAKNFEQGKPLQETDLVLLRPGTGIPPRDIRDVIGRRLKHSLDTGTTLQWEHLEKA